MNFRIIRRPEVVKLYMMKNEAKVIGGRDFNDKVEDAEKYMYFFFCWVLRMSELVRALVVVLSRLTF